MKQFLKQIAVVIGLFLVLAYLLSAGSLWSLRKSSFYKPSFLVNAVEEDTFDYIVLGASTGLTTLDTKAIDEQAGSKGINLSMDDTGLSSHYLMLEHFLAEGKTTKYCIIAPGVNAYDATVKGLNDNDYRFLMFVNRPYISRYFSEVEEKDMQSNVLSSSKWFPFIGVSYFNAEIFYPSILSLIQPKKRNRFDEAGNYTYPVKRKQLKFIKKKQSNLTFSNPTLVKLNKLCKTNNIELIYYIAPLRAENMVLDLTENRVIDHSAIIDKDEYFYDNIHVNSNGREITSRIFAEQLSEILK